MTNSENRQVLAEERGFDSMTLGPVFRGLASVLKDRHQWHHFRFEAQIDEQGGLHLRGLKYGLSEAKGWTWTVKNIYVPPGMLEIV